MGKHFPTRLSHESQNKQPGCIWGLVQALDYLQWQPNMRKRIKHNIFKHLMHDKSEWSSESKIYSPDNDDEAEKLLPENESPYISSERIHATKKTSIKAHIRALMPDETFRENKERRGKKGSSRKPNLQRTYSIHHLESLDDDRISKIRIDSRKSVTSVPEYVDGKGSQLFDHTIYEETDVLEIFKVDKDLFTKHLQKGDEHVSNFQEKLTKSRSFPERKLKPANLENKQREIWPFPRENKFQNINNEANHNSLDRTLVTYAYLLSASRSLKLTTEYRNGPVYLRRLRSLSNVDFSYSIEASEVQSGSPIPIMQQDSEGGNVGPAANIEILDDFKEVEEKEEKNDHSCPDIQGSSFTLDPSTDQPKSDYSCQKPLDLENDKASSECPDSDDFVRRLLDRSGIAADAREMTWYSLDQPLGPHLLEQARSLGPDEKGLMDTQLLFDLINEVLVELYDLCLPYYPVALCSGCRVPLFPEGICIIEAVCVVIRKLLDVEAEDRQGLEPVVARDLWHDQKWMNLQLDMESMALELEDMIFGQLLEEMLCS